MRVLRENQSEKQIRKQKEGGIARENRIQLTCTCHRKWGQRKNEKIPRENRKRLKTKLSRERIK